MDLLQSLPALVRLGLILAAILGLLRVKVPLAGAIMAGGAILAALFEMTFNQYFKSLVSGLFSFDTLFMATLIVGTVTLSNALNDSGQIQRLIKYFRALVGESRIMLVAFPAMIGLLPMPGGAIFSAPMVDEVSEPAGLSPVLRTVANYHFRHVWEYWFPLYPGVILAMSMTDIEPWRFILLALPMTFVSIGSGCLCILRGVRMAGKRALNLSRQNLGRFGYEMIPVFIMIVAVFVVAPLMGWVGLIHEDSAPAVERSPILLGLVVALAWVCRVNRMEQSVFWKLFIKKNVLSMAFLVTTVMIFRVTLESGSAVDALHDDLVAYGIPMVAVVAVIPFIAGVIVGIAVGYVGVSFPLVIALLGASGLSPSEHAPYIFLAYSCGYAGMMLSPVHLCLLLTRDYFKSSLLGVYGYLIPLHLISLTATGLLFWLYT